MATFKGARWNHGNPTTPAITDNVVYVTLRVVELLLVRPFTFGCQDSKQGMHGVGDMTFQMNMLPNANRALRSVSTVHATVIDPMPIATMITPMPVAVEMSVPH